MTRIDIEYCVECLYLGRALEVAEVLLNEFSDEIEALALVPGTRGVFTVALDGEAICAIQPGELPPSPQEVRRKVQATLTRVKKER